jgi:predicted ATPase/Tfp pilus assembly protein PilF
MPTADLDIDLDHSDAPGSYFVELRLSLPGSAADIAPVRGLAQFETGSLYQQALDSTACGRFLTQGLFSEPAVREYFNNARISAQALDVPLRLRLSIGPGAPELHSLRWETLRDPQHDVSLVTRERVLFSRHVSSPDFRPVRLRSPGNLRALLMIANPADLASYRPGGRALTPLDVPGELTRAQAGLGSIPMTALASQGSATFNNLSTQLREGYDILYLICHGALIEGQPWLWLEGENGRTARVSGQELVMRLSEIQRRPTLVVLASCQSAGTGESATRGDEGTMAALGPRLAEAGIPAVLAVQGSISVQTAGAFMPVFFRELRRDGQIDRATAAARAAIRDRDDHWMPALFMRLRSGCIWLQADTTGAAATLPPQREAPTGTLPLPEPGLREPELTVVAPSPADPVTPTEEPARAALEEGAADSASTPWNNLPRQLTSFVGREKETTEVKERLFESCLLTLTGSGGCGKTRLALQAAQELSGQFAEGVGLVELGALTEAALVPQRVATALEVREEAGRSPTDTLVDFLRDRSFLLLLDNCEHLVLACAELAQTLLRRCQQLRILATSREALEIPGELIYRVPPLSLPDPRRLPPLDRLTEYAALRLFVERATVSQPRFALTAENAAAVTQVCCQLDGIPLAIELAAARVKVLSVEQIAQRLKDRFRLLTGGSRTVLKHQQTLRALIDWSYDLLSEAERRLLQRLAVFAGSWALEAAEAVCSGDGVEDWEVLDLMTELVDKSLVVPEEPPAPGLQDAPAMPPDRNDGWNETRYHLLNTVRQYAYDRLLEAGEEAPVRARHRDYFLKLAEEAEPNLRGAQQAAWLARLECEHDNLRAAIAGSIERGEAEAGLRLGAALWYFWHVRGHLREGRDRLDAVLALPAKAECDLPRARALNAAGALADDQGEYASAVRYHEESLVIARACDDRETMAYALFSQGNVCASQQQFEQATALYEQALVLWRALGNQSRVAVVLANLGWALQRLGRPETAVPHIEESLVLNRQLGNLVAVANTLNNLGTIHLDQGQYERAAPVLSEGLCLAQQCDNSRGIAVMLNNLARLAAEQGDRERAASMLAKVKALCEEIGAALPEDYSQNVALVRNGMGEARFEAAASQGRATSLEQVITSALEMCHAETTRPG